MTKPIIIDCDPGHDDALALLLAYAWQLQSKWQIIGVTTIGGNQTLDKVTLNARNILAALGAKIPLAKGQEGPLINQLQTGGFAHGDSGMAGPSFPEPDYPLVEKSGILFLYDLILASEMPVTLIALGPLTNIALLIKTFPEIKSKIEVISLMGGGISHGNFTPSAEFNFYVDPQAAKIVYDSGIPIVMSGLDVTEKATITLDEIKALEGKGKFSQLAYELLSFYNQSGRQFGFVDSALHDVCAVAYLLQPDLFKRQTYAVDIITNDGPTRGMSLADKRLKPDMKNSILVLESVDRTGFVKLVCEALDYLDQQDKDRSCHVL